MEISTRILKEADVLLVSVIMGIILLFVYDQLRIIRRLIPHGAFWVAVEDVLFWIASAAALFAMMYQENSGYIRGFVIGGVLVGMLLYNLVLSRFVVNLSVLILKKIVFIISRPFAWTGRLLKKPACFLVRVGRRIVRFWKKWLKKIWKTVKMGLCKL